MMNKLAIAVLGAVLLSNAAMASDPTTPASAGPGPVSRMATYEKTTGEIFFALSLIPQDRLPEVEHSDIVVLFDTSASQVGLYREDAFVCLERLIDGLRDSDRIQIMAIDLKPVPMNDGLAAPRGEAIKSALAKLKKRTPLGSTDVPSGLLAGLKTLEAVERASARNIIYIGDGVSRANFIDAEEMTKLQTSLRSGRVSVSSFTIGPQRNVELLATLANHTGGSVAIDEEGSRVAVVAGAALARVSRGAVLWPVEAKLDEAILVSYPERFPPLRMDRDTVLLGMLKSRNKQRLELKTIGVRGEKTLTWELKPESANPEFGFLPNLIERAARDGGLRLPTAGSAALKEVGRVILSNARTMLKLGNQAIKREDFKAALSAANSVLERDPDNPEARALKRAAERGVRRQELKAKQSKQAAEKDKSPQPEPPKSD